MTMFARHHDVSSLGPRASVDATLEASAESMVGTCIPSNDNFVSMSTTSSTSGGYSPDVDEKSDESSFKIDDGWVRNWFFENIETDVMVMTMPDINQYQVKRSRHKVHYVYTQHSLVSLHMVYRPGALDHYDSIFVQTNDKKLSYKKFQLVRVASVLQATEHIPVSPEAIDHHPVSQWRNLA